MTNRFVVFILLLMYFLINNSNCNISEKDKRVFKISNLNFLFLIVLFKFSKVIFRNTFNKNSDFLR